MDQMLQPNDTDLAEWIQKQDLYICYLWKNTVQKHQVFSDQLYLQSNSYSHTWLLEKPYIAFTRWTFVGKERIKVMIPNGSKSTHKLIDETEHQFTQWTLIYHLVIKNPPASAGDLSSILGSGRSLGDRNGNPLQYSCLGNPMDRGAWRAIVRGVAKQSDTT